MNPRERIQPPHPIATPTMFVRASTMMTCEKQRPETDILVLIVIRYLCCMCGPELAQGSDQCDAALALCTYYEVDRTEAAHNA